MRIILFSILLFICSCQNELKEDLARDKKTIDSIDREIERINREIKREQKEIYKIIINRDSIKN